jgi:death on curing protein
MIFLRKAEILIIHEIAIENYGGTYGFLNEHALDSAIHAPENRHYYEEADLIICAATYAYHVTNAHAFIDGNKRAGAGCTIAFLHANGAILRASEDDLFNLFKGIADGEISRDDAGVLLRRWVLVP